MTQLSQLSDMTGRMVTVRSTDDRVELIAKNVQKGRISPAVHVFAAAALSQKCDGEWCIPPMKWRAEVQQLGKAIQDNVRYTLDTYNIDTYRTPDRTLQMAIGDCDDMTALGGAVLQAVGYPVMIKVIQLNGMSDFHHIYLVVGLPPHDPQQWVAFDPTQRIPVGAEPYGIIDSRHYEIN